VHGRRLARAVHPTQQQTAPTEMQRLVPVLEDVDDPGSFEPPAASHGHDVTDPQQPVGSVDGLAGPSGPFRPIEAANRPRVITPADSRFRWRDQSRPSASKTSAVPGSNTVSNQVFSRLARL